MTRNLDRYLDIGYEDRMLGGPLLEPAEISRWLITTGQALEAHSPLAVLRGGGQDFTIRTRFPCVVDGLVAEVGERLYKGMVLLRVGAARASEPEGRHYCEILPAE